MQFDFEVDGRPATVAIEPHGSGLALSVNGVSVAADVVRLGRGRYSLRLPASGRQHQLTVTPHGGNGAVSVAVGGVEVAVTRRTTGAGRRRRGGVAGDGPDRVVAPMPGKVVKLLVRPGDEVTARQGVVVVEAMKMENELRAGRAGVVREVLVVEGASVDAGAPLVVIG